MFNLLDKWSANRKQDIPYFDNNSIRIIIIASLVIIAGTVLMGVTSYNITRAQIVNKLQSEDLINIAQAISTKVDSRIDRAKETAVMLANDPVIFDWVKSAEEDSGLGVYAKQKIREVVTNYDYNNSFIVSNITKNYWSENGVIIDTMTTKDPDDSWFFETIASDNDVSLSLDYNKERNATFVFVNALVQEDSTPIAITGVGLSLEEVAKEFQGYKTSGNTDLWLIDKAGTIYLANNVEDIEQNITDFIPEETLSALFAEGSQTQVMDYTDRDNEIFDLISQPLESTSWSLLVQIPRQESISIIQAIKHNTIIGSLIITCLIVLLFYLISNKIANPYKRALLLSQRLEKEVKERTQELADKNATITESIEYAQIIQQSVFPTSEYLNGAFKEFAVFWTPKDIVGGDFYWSKERSGSHVLAVGDCTGHGVPGALLTMAVSSMLNQIVTTDDSWQNDPAMVLQRLNQLFKNSINNGTRRFEEGLDIGIAIINDSEIIYAGAKMDLYAQGNRNLTVLKGDRKTIGYEKTAVDFRFQNYTLSLNEYDCYYLTTDGLLDQNGGVEDYSFGRSRFMEFINEYHKLPLAQQIKKLETILREYRDEAPQRDDITVVSFRVKR